MPTPGPEGRVRNISFTLRAFPKPAVLLLFPAKCYGAAQVTSKSPTVVGLLSPKSTDDFVVEGKVTMVPLVRSLSTKVG